MDIINYNLDLNNTDIKEKIELGSKILLPFESEAEAILKCGLYREDLSNTYLAYKDSSEEMNAFVITVEDISESSEALTTFQLSSEIKEHIDNGGYRDIKSFYLTRC